jgi:hypothetical protein
MGVLIMNNEYKEQGYKDRNDYLKSLANEFGVDIGAVYMIANTLGPDEDFDALVIELEDYANMMDSTDGDDSDDGDDYYDDNDNDNDNDNDYGYNDDHDDFEL